MTSHVNHPTNHGVLRRRLEAMLHEHLDRADECRPDDPALEGHLTAAIQLNAALERVDSGTYGICRQCYEPISPTRIDAVPAAALCIDCQRIPRPFLI
ncbi:TraR/DksA family transcriptional regulator [Aquihabitans daechungensis]|uniref:TraR/DksA family transcriptional regulator n=1 Tax=Aquihabitans daechungensis TaxID=1052257 RepID=UPI003B9F15A1